MEQASGGHQLPLMAGDLVARPECPVCAATVRSHFRDLRYGKQNLIRHFRCEACGLIYMDPVPTQGWYDRLYGDEFWEKKAAERGNSEVWTNKQQWYRGLARAEKYIDLMRGSAPNAAIASVLEIGASFGLIGTAVAEAYGARAFGVEPNHAARDFAARASGMSMVAETAAGLDAWQRDVPVDLAIFSHVLENIIDPRSALTAVHRKLKPGGLLLIETPNIDWQPSMSIYHPYCFSASALQLLLEQSGFRIVHVRKSGRPSSRILPRYLTILAEAVAATRAAAPPRRVLSTGSVKARHRLVKLFKSPIGGVEYVLATRRFYATPFVKRGIAKLKANVSRFKSAPEQAPL
jgi:SAM-dependent methyltransferase